MIRVLSIVLATLLLAATAVAQTGDPGWPDRPIRLVVPFPAGSSTDIVARIVAQKLGQRLGQQIVVENRAGASGNIGVDAVAKAAPDGYTIGIATASTQAVAVSLGTNLPYDPVKDFAPVAMIGSQPYVLVLYPGLPAQDMAQLIALAKAKPGALNYGSAGVASLAHLATALFASMAGVNIPSALQELGAIHDRHDHRPARHAVRDHRTVASQYPRRTIARAGDQRQDARRRAAGGPDRRGVRPRRIRSGFGVALVAPPATPTAIIARLNREVNEILDSADGTEAMIAQGMTPEPGPPDAVTERIRNDIEKWRDVVAKAGIRAE